MPSHWYLLKTKPRKERFVCHVLQARGFDVFSPALHLQPHSPFSRKFQACFAGYLFVQVDPERRSLQALNWVPGAQTLVELAGEPVMVPARLLSSVEEVGGGLAGGALPEELLRELLSLLGG